MGLGSAEGPGSAVGLGSAEARTGLVSELGAQNDRNRPAPQVTLGAPRHVTARGGRGQVALTWRPVDRAIGYLVHRAESGDGPWQPIDHGGGDVLAVPHPPYVDTTGSPGRPAWYAVAAVSSIDAPPNPLSDPVEATPLVNGSADVSVTVVVRDPVGPLARPWRPMIGSEHLALLLRGAGPGGRIVGDELEEAFRVVRRELGVERVRAHAILHDSLCVYRERDGRPIFDFDRVDAAYDRLLGTGLRPVVELGFMPRDLAADPEATVFDYRGIISPPRDRDRWAELVRVLAGHLVERFGRNEVRGWPFEVWNEANLRVFWRGDEHDYLDLYDASARALKSVDAAIRVGGPATAAVGWVDDFLAHAAETETPVDFLSTHTYGLPPLDLRPIAARFGRPDIPLWWTEWGVSPNHGSGINDSVWAAPLVCRGMRSAAGRVESVSSWVASDHFVELGEPERLFHGGFGLLTVGNLRKPRFWALRVLELLGDMEIRSAVEGDGGGGLVEAWATRDDGGRVAIALWNGTIDQSKATGAPLLDRNVRLRMEGLGPGRWTLRHRRIDLHHSNIANVYEDAGGGDWPDDGGWEALRRADVLEELEPVRGVTVGPDGRFDLSFGLPMPAVSLVELIPDTAR